MIAINQFIRVCANTKGVVRIKVPEHLGIVPDGNRRFAKRLLENPGKGHEWGMKKVERIMGWCRELGIKNVTLYMLSLENLDKRPKMELEFLFSLARNELDDVISNPRHWVHETRTRLTFMGQLDRLPEDLQARIEKVRDATKSYRKYTLNLAIAYGGRQEIVDAARKLASDVLKGRISPEKIDEKAFRSSLFTSSMPDPDLIIRTGGENRISNFLTFQSTYSELVFLDTLWPELERDEFLKSIRDFSERERRFGK
jgi:tritrans,polycis-undecaprenyl-diphosphate synthase [geranylgeranyl-diphosphate specific]